MDISEAQKDVDTWIRTYGNRYFDEMTNLANLMEETGELASLMSRHFGEQSFKEGKKPKDIHSALSDEMADILWIILALSNQMNIDLNEALMNNIRKKTERDSDRHLRNEKL